MHGKDVVFTGGGTGGHVFPGLAVSDVLPTRIKSLWIISRGGMEQGILSKQNVEYLSIPAGKLRREFSFSLIFEMFLVLAGFFYALYYLLRIRPKVVFSKGGYVTVPVVFAARCLQIPVVQHESDYEPGLATRMTLPLAQCICLSWQDSINYIPRKYQHKAHITGNPVRATLSEGNPVWRVLGRITMAIIGGSSGAAELNSLVDEVQSDPQIVAKTMLVHQHGRNYHPKHAPSKHYVAKDFFYEDYADMLASADIIICRAGASMLGELALLGKAAILIPLTSTVSRGEQIVNARNYAKQGAARVLIRPTAQELLQCINEILSDTKNLEQMRYAALAQASPDAAMAIARHIIHIGGGHASG